MLLINYWRILQLILLLLRQWHGVVCGLFASMIGMAC